MPVYVTDGNQNTLVHHALPFHCALTTASTHSIPPLHPRTVLPNTTPVRYHLCAHKTSAQSSGVYCLYCLTPSSPKAASMLCSAQKTAPSRPEMNGHHINPHFGLVSTRSFPRNPSTNPNNHVRVHAVASPAWCRAGASTNSSPSAHHLFFHLFQTLT